MRNRLAAALAVLCLLASLVTVAELSPVSAALPAHAAGKHGKKHARKHGTVKKNGCIPQTNHGTDHDPDNHGGPNDGDGCV